MLKETGMLVHCGWWRFAKEVKRSSVAINFVTSVEVFDEESSEVIDDLRESIQEVVGRWSRCRFRKMKKQERSLSIRRNK